MTLFVLVFYSSILNGQAKAPTSFSKRRITSLLNSLKQFSTSHATKKSIKILILQIFTVPITFITIYRPFLSYKISYFQNKAKCKTLLVCMGLTSMRIKIHFHNKSFAPHFETEPCSNSYIHVQVKYSIRISMYKVRPSNSFLIFTCKCKHQKHVQHLKH